MSDWQGGGTGRADFPVSIHCRSRRHSHIRGERGDRFPQQRRRIIIELRPFERLGQSELPGLSARHHFCFAAYQQPDRLSWGGLRILNDDRIPPGGGDQRHPCDGFQIVTYVAEGEIAHDGSFGGPQRTAAGHFQIISTGRGIIHGMANPGTEPAHAFEFRFRSPVINRDPRVERRAFPNAPGLWEVIASGIATDEDGARIDADARLLAARLAAGSRIERPLIPDRHQYLVVVGGGVTLAGAPMTPGDGAAIHGEAMLTLDAATDAEVILVDAV